MVILAGRKRVLFGRTRYPQHRRVLGEKYNWDRPMDTLRQVVLSAGD